MIPTDKISTLAEAINGHLFEEISFTTSGIVASSDQDLFNYTNGLWSFDTNFNTNQTILFENNTHFLLTQKNLFVRSNSNYELLVPAEGEQEFQDVAIVGNGALIATDIKACSFLILLIVRLIRSFLPVRSSDVTITSIALNQDISMLSNKGISQLETNTGMWQNTAFDNTARDFDLSLYSTIAVFEEGLFVEDESTFTPIDVFSPSNTLTSLNGNYRLSGIESANDQHLWLVQQNIFLSCTNGIK